MLRRMMAKMARGELHDCAPKDWRKVPNVVGDYDLDATLLHRNNANLPNLLRMYISRDSGPRTGYNAYHNYKGDS